MEYSFVDDSEKKKGKVVSIKLRVNDRQVTLTANGEMVFFIGSDGNCIRYGGKGKATTDDIEMNLSDYGV